jgi:Ion channel
MSTSIEQAVAERRATIAWIATAVALAGAAVLGLLYDWPLGAMGFIAGLVDLYLLFALLEAALRSTKAESRPKHRWKLELPNLISSLVILPLLLAAAVFAFAGMYRRQTCGIIRTAAETESTYGAKRGAALTPREATCIVSERVEPLRSRVDAVYFSAVTIATVGYGDFVPGRAAARLLVLWEIATGLLLLVGALPLVVSRLADF